MIIWAWHIPVAQCGGPEGRTLPTALQAGLSIDLDAEQNRDGSHSLRDCRAGVVLEIGPIKDAPDRTLPRQVGSVSCTMWHQVPSSCQSLCGSAKYFGLQDGGQCFCGDDWSKATRETTQVVCGPCGGPWCNYVWSNNQPIEFYGQHRQRKAGNLKLAGRQSKVPSGNRT